MMTYRYRGHSMSDPGKYRSREEVEQMMESDPIQQWAKVLTGKKKIKKAELDAIDEEILAQIEEAVRFVDESPDPPPESIYEDVYVRTPYIHMPAAEKDPAWAAAESEDRVPEEFPARTAEKVES
jgi:TPP-dependent pyruvate/acetoin dehydrogenase alpha subunit